MRDVERSLEEELFAEFPQWENLARTVVGDDGHEYIVVAVAAPSDAVAEPGLVVDTAHGEITVAFDFYESHFHDYVEYGGHIGTAAAAAFIRDLMSEKVAVVSWWNAETWRGSARLQAGAPLPTPSWAEPGTYNRVRVRSWGGRLDADKVA
jgi:hypothetical protein